jgi:hypothetical protein
MTNGQDVVLKEGIRNSDVDILQPTAKCIFEGEKLGRNCNAFSKRTKKTLSRSCKENRDKKEAQFVCTLRRFIVAINNGK